MMLRPDMLATVSPAMLNGTLVLLPLIATSPAAVVDHLRASRLR